jgi:hypothetical protein
LNERTNEANDNDESDRLHSRISLIYSKRQQQSGSGFFFFFRPFILLKEIVIIHEATGADAAAAVGTLFDFSILAPRWGSWLFHLILI